MKEAICDKCQCYCPVDGDYPKFFAWCETCGDYAKGFDGLEYAGDYKAALIDAERDSRDE